MGERSRKTTMADVAEAAGVSLSAVDRVLNGRGGVAPEKANRVLSAARRLGLDRALVLRPTRILRVGVLIQGPGNPFHAALREGIDLAARLHAGLNLQFRVAHVDPNRPDRIAAAIRAETGRCDGLIVTVPDVAPVAAALGEAARLVPVVTLADDVPGSGRAAHVGPDDYRAGRVAGDLVGRLMRPAGGRVVMIAGLRALAGHRAREAGLRDVLATFHPGCAVSAVLESGEDPERAGLLVARALRADPGVRGVYHATNGLRSVVGALRRLGRAGDTVVVTHELTEARRAFLRARAVDAVIDQNPHLEAQVAVETMARLLGRLDGEPRTALRTDFAIYMAENA
jgi:LacI family transcriptional regulator